MGFMTGLTSTLSKGAVLDTLGLPALDRPMTARAKVDTCFDEQIGMWTAMRVVTGAATTLSYRSVNGIEFLLPRNARVTGLTKWTRLIEE